MKPLTKTIPVTKATVQIICLRPLYTGPISRDEKVGWLVGCLVLTPYQQLWSYHGESKVGHVFGL